MRNSIKMSTGEKAGQNMFPPAVREHSFQRVRNNHQTQGVEPAAASPAPIWAEAFVADTGLRRSPD